MVALSGNPEKAGKMLILPARVPRNHQHGGAESLLTLADERGRTSGMEQGQYTELKKHAGEALLNQANQFDKAILTLAAGALALSLTFIKDVAPAPNALIIGLLTGAWACFIGSVCITLISFQTGICAHRRFDENLNIQQRDPATDSNSLKNCWVGVTITLNFASLIVFIIGTVLLTCSAYHGLKLKEHNVPEQRSNMNQTEQRGAVPPTPPVPPGELGAIPPSPPVSGPRTPPPSPPPPTKK